MGASRLKRNEVPEESYTHNSALFEAEEEAVAGYIYLTFFLCSSETARIPLISGPAPFRRLSVYQEAA